MKKKNKRAVLLIDEFQEVHQVAKDAGIESAIRHVAQETKNFTIIFSGSHRNLLKNMFNHRNKPLYRLCDEIVLDRISREDYLPFLKKFSLEKWQQSLDANTLERIFELSDLHPYYFNAICEKLFIQEELPKTSDVEWVWQELVASKKKDILHETKVFSIAHKKILAAIAHGINQELTAQKFLSQAEISGASVFRALEYLEENDFIEKINNQYRLIDPLLKSILMQLTYF